MGYYGGPSIGRSGFYKPASLLPFASDVAAYWRMDALAASGGSLALSGSNVSAVNDIVGKAAALTPTGTLAYNAAAGDTTGLGGFVNFSDGASYLNIPAGFSVDKRNFSAFVWWRKNNNAQVNYNALLMMPSTAANLAMILDNAYTQQLWDNVSPTDTTFGSCYSMHCSDMTGAAANFYSGTGSSLYTKGAALAAGSVAGGRIGLWTGTSFPLYASVKCVLFYSRALTLAERTQVLAWGQAQFGAVSSTCQVFHEFTGDSRVFGVGTTSSDDYSFPSQYARLHTSTPKFYQDGSGGDTIQANTAMTRQIARLNNNTGYASRVLWIAYGINDITAGRTDTQIIADHGTAITNARAGAAGVKIIVPTVMSKSGLNTTQQTYLASVNSWIKNTAPVDAVVDFATVLPDPANTTNFNADALHPTNAGYAQLAAASKAITDVKGWVP